MDITYVCVRVSVRFHVLVRASVDGSYSIFPGRSISKAVAVGITPTLQSMAVIGLVSIPGTRTTSLLHPLSVVCMYESGCIHVCWTPS